MGFAHLHTHSSYSLLNGVPTPGELAAKAASLGQGALALTDDANLFGALDHQKACDEHGIQAIFGATISVWPQGLAQLSPEDPDTGWELVLLVQESQGWKNLCKLITVGAAHMHYRPRIDLDLLHTHQEGLLVLTSGTHGPLGPRQDEGAARTNIESLQKKLDAGRLHLELQDLGIPSYVDLCRRARQLSVDLGLPLVATNEVRYLEPADCVALNTLHASATGRPLKDLGPYQVQTDQAYLKTETELSEMHGVKPVQLGETIARSCTHRIETGVFRFPSTDPPSHISDDRDRWHWLHETFPLPPHARAGRSPFPSELPKGHTLLDAYFAWYARRGLDGRQVPQRQKKVYAERLATEIDLIITMGFSAYFLIVAEFINWAKSRGIPVGPGRGSVAGALTAWAAGITAIDSIRYNLYFERFLNPARKSMPDIDVDFSKARRDEVIAHVRERYGADCVSQIITMMAFHPRSAITDVARALRIGFQDAKRWTSLIENKATTLETELKQPALTRLMEGHLNFRRTAQLSIGIEGCLRQRGVHAAGIVLGDRPLVNYAPIYPDKEGHAVIGLSMDDVEATGLIKFDFLGLKTLDVLHQACDIIFELTGERLDLDKLPLDDEATWQLLSDGDALGLFQVESAGMQSLLRKLEPRSLEDLTALIALYRPGPIQSGMVDDFVDRRHGEAALAYPHPLLEDVLKPTYGTITYQEQVMRSAQVLAGYSLAEADLLRRAMGKKKKEEMAAQRERFISGCSENGIRQSAAVELFDLIDKFSGYGFNKSHACAYALVVYQTAFLKAHHRAAFLAAVMTWDSQDHDKLALLIEDCRGHIQVLGPDINLSGGDFTVERQAGGALAIRYGLAAITGLGDKALESILGARREAPIKSLSDFAARVDRSVVNKTVVKSMAAGGAFDSLGVRRHEVASLVASRPKSKKVPSSQLVFSQVPAPVFATLTKEEPWSWSDRSRHQIKALGVCLDRHPLDRCSDIEHRFRTASIDQLNTFPNNHEADLVAVIRKVHKIKAHGGRPMSFVTLVDRTGLLEAVVNPETHERYGSCLEVGMCIRACGRIKNNGEEVGFNLTKAQDLDEIRSRMATSLEITVDHAELDTRLIDRLKELLEDSSGSVGVRLAITKRGSYQAILRLPETLKVQPSRELFADLERAIGRSGRVSVLG